MESFSSQWSRTISS